MEMWVWLILAAVGIVVEALSPQLVSIWFVLGFVAALIASMFGAPLYLQIIIALAVSVISLIATRPLVKKMTGTKVTRTNADRYVGEEGVVTDEINAVLGTGRVTVMGSNWAAVCSGSSIVPVGTKVQVEAIEGVKLIVKVL